MAQKIINKLSKDDIIELYKYVCRYETCIKPNKEQFDINNKELEKLIRMHDIYLDTCAKKNHTKALKHRYHILYEQYSKSKASGKDKAHHLMRHIRNCIAHGYIQKDKADENFILYDNNGTRDTMSGKIGVKSFYELIKKLENSKKQ